MSIGIWFKDVVNVSVTPFHVRVSVVAAETFANRVVVALYTPHKGIILDPKALLICLMAKTIEIFVPSPPVAPPNFPPVQTVVKLLVKASMAPVVALNRIPVVVQMGWLAAWFHVSFTP